VRRAAPWWLVPAGAYLATLVVFLVWSPEARTAFPLDDAWIHRVYARALASGHGFAYNDAQEAGCTSPLWVVLTAPAQWLAPLGTSAVVVGVKLVGALCGGAAVAAVYRLTRLLGAAAWAAALAAALIGSEPALAFSALAGMEVVLALALWLWAVTAIRGGHWRATWVVLGALPVARPEAAVLVGVAIAAIAVRGELGRALRTPWLAALVLPSLAWAAFCELATGHLLANTFYIKGELRLDAVTLLPRVLVQHGWSRTIVVLVVGLGALAACAKQRADRVAAALLAIGSLGFVAAVLVTRVYLPSGYYWTRWTEPGVLGFAAATAVGLALGLDAAIAHRANVITTALAVALAASLPLELASIGERARRFASDAHAVAELDIAPGEWLAAHTPADAVVAVNDAGAMRYFGQRTTIDLMGLNNADLAFHRIAPDALVAKVDFAAVYPVLGRAYPWLRAFPIVAEFTMPPGTNTLVGGVAPELVVIGRRPDAPTDTTTR
jgi:hypothetical protein